MKTFIYFFLIVSFLLLSCNQNNPKVDPEKIIGVEFNPNLPPYGFRGLSGHKNINGVLYYVHGVYYKGKVLVFICEDNIIANYYFSNLIVYDKVKNIPIGTSYEELINILGEPVGLICGSNYIEYYQL